MDINNIFNYLFIKKTLPKNLLKINIKKELNEILEEEHLIKIKQAFENAPKQRINAKTFRQLLTDVAKLDYSDDEFVTEYLKMCKSSDGCITWSCFIQFLLGQFEEKEFHKELVPLELPIVKPLRIIKSNHRQPVNKICFYPAILPDQSVNWINGSYLTLSKDGGINYWNTDFNLTRTVHTKCSLKLQSTWLTDMVVLPDVSVVCVSNTECELGFYDVSAKKFDLRILLNSLECAVTTMNYYYDLTKPNEESKLLLGDQNGTVRIIFINPAKRGPFKSEPKFLLRQIQWKQFVKNPGCIAHMRLIEFQYIHANWVRKVAFYSSINCFISIANCVKQSMYVADMSRKTTYSFDIPSGVYCMCFIDSKHLIVTGGSDCLIRLWNTFVPNRPNVCLYGHHAAIRILILQNDGKQLFSMSHDKIVKIWNLTSLICIQTYKGLQKELPDCIDYGHFYNDNTKEVFIGSTKIAILVVYGVLNPEETDGYTHTDSISVLLYNPLFKMLVTCGLESNIISWDPFKGTRLSVIKEAHVQHLHGNVLCIQITAATFNPQMQLLLTGARDGTLKIWQSKLCIRHMAIEPRCEVTAVMWVPLRIFAMGWNRRVTEFADTADQFGCKLWDVMHLDGIICADINVPLILAAASFKGELVFWRLDTNQPYKRFDVTNPTKRMPVKYLKKRSLIKTRSTTSLTRSTILATRTNKTKMKSAVLPTEPITLRALSARINRTISFSQPEQILKQRPCSVITIKFLQSRPSKPDIGSVVVALENGIMQIYSHHTTGKFLKSFQATHGLDDYITACETDLINEYLFTGSKNGYIKTWLIINYALPNEFKVVMPKYRLIFPFLWTDTIQCRAKRAVRNQPLPILCNSYRAHMTTITGLVYINDCQILCSSGSDRSVRLWTLGGKYINTLGTFQPWIEISHFGPPLNDLPNKIPPDIKRIASWTTLKVFNGGKAPRTEKKRPPAEIQPLTKDEIEKGIYGESLTEPILGHHFKFPNRSDNYFNIQLDNSLPFVPIYSHLTTELPIKEIEKISCARTLIKRKNENH